MAIKTTQGKVLDAYAALNRIRQRVKGHDALHLFHMKNKLQENIDFQTEEEKKLVDEYGGVITEAGQVLIDDKEKRLAFREEYRKLNEMECEVDTEVLVLNLDRNPEITLEDIEQLSGFIDFK